VWRGSKTNFGRLKASIPYGALQLRVYDLTDEQRSKIQVMLNDVIAHSGSGGNSEKSLLDLLAILDQRPFCTKAELPSEVDLDVLRIMDKRGWIEGCGQYVAQWASPLRDPGLAGPIEVLLARGGMVRVSAGGKAALAERAFSRRSSRSGVKAKVRPADDDERIDEASSSRLWTFADASRETGVPKVAWTRAAKKKPGELGYLPHRTVGRTKQVTHRDAMAFARDYDARRDQRAKRK
jgi:hypothetical protein